MKIIKLKERWKQAVYLSLGFCCCILNALSYSLIIFIESWLFSHMRLVLRVVPERILILFLGAVGNGAFPSFASLQGYVCRHSEARRGGGPEGESILLFSQHLLLTIIDLAFKAPPLYPDRPGLWFVKRHLNNRCQPYTPNWSCVAFSKSYRDNCLHHNWASFLKLRLSREGWMPSRCLPGINSLEYLADTRPDSQKGMYVEEVGLLP